MEGRQVHGLKRTFGGTKVDRPRLAMKLIVNLRIVVFVFSQFLHTVLDDLSQLTYHRVQL